MKGAPMTEHSHTRRSFIAAGIASAAVVVASGIAAVAETGTEVSPELARLVRDLEAARVERDVVMSVPSWTDDDVAPIFDKIIDLEQQITSFHVRTAGDLVVLAEQSRKLVATYGELNENETNALINGILRLFG
jgi:hypothetical protein